MKKVSSTSLPYKIEIALRFVQLEDLRDAFSELHSVSAHDIVLNVSDHRLRDGFRCSHLLNECFRILATSEFLKVFLYAVKLVYALDIELILCGNKACLDLLLHLRLQLVKAALPYVFKRGGFKVL